jgi:uncharacterized membrane protein
MSASSILSPEQQQQLVGAIKAAERATSGEIKVHIEHHCESSDVLVRAQELFRALQLHRTERRNGVLFYLATTDRKFAVLGDQGINEAVPDNFWESTRDLMREYFKNEQFVEGLSAGIQLAGQQLKAFFPWQDDDTNELSDEISFGN